MISKGEKGGMRKKDEKNWIYSFSIFSLLICLGREVKKYDAEKIYLANICRMFEMDGGAGGNKLKINLLLKNTLLGILSSPLFLSGWNFILYETTMGEKVKKKTKKKPNQNLSNDHNIF